MWTPYENFPDLSGAKLIAFDTETKDPYLKEKGPGSIRKDGHVIGFSIATDDGFKGYYPIRHEGGGNLENVEGAIRWFKDTLENKVDKLGANILYDMEWCKMDLGINVNGKKFDIQVADPIIDENYQSYSLDNCAKRWLGEQKAEDALYFAGVNILGLTPKGKNIETDLEKKKDIIGQVKGQLYKLHSQFVGEYGEEDARLPIDIFMKQKKVLEENNLWNIFLMETKLVDIIFAMRMKGIPVDLEKANIIRKQLQEKYDEYKSQFLIQTGCDIDIWSNQSIAEMCDKKGFVYERTAKGNPSFDAEWLGSQENPVFKTLLKMRQYDRSGGVFIQSKIIDLEINGRIHPNWFQVKGERGGTVSGRLASANPNAQQFPARNEELAKLVRSIMVAEKGKNWCVFDYSQQEPRVTIHYAYILGLSGATKAKEQFCENPRTDYHQMVADWTELPRKVAKSVNLGLAYGMGAKKYANNYGKSLQEAKDIYNIYHRRLPYVKELSERCERAAKQKGYIKTILERHCNFNLYGPPAFKPGTIPLRKKEAIEKYGQPVIQYFTYKALNRLIQGSSADMIKKAMIDCYDAGYIPNMSVHDELDFADIENDKQIKEIQDIMLNAVKLEVPLVVDIEKGENWGDCKEINI